MNLKTHKLYDLDSHTKAFQAKVVSCEPIETTNGTTYQVVLDQTAFFPEGGGQSADLGFLNNIAVIDVQETDDIIYHTMMEPINPGTVVQGEIDWNTRFDLMQQHTGEHIISGLVHHYYGYDNVGFHMGSDAITIDFNGTLTQENLRKIEQDANLAVYKNLPVLVTFPTSEELKNLNYRSKKELSGNVRIVTIGDYDICACCAPHVALTGEIGGIKIISSQSYKGGVRISMLCGLRALEDYNKKEENVLAISSLLSAKPYEVKEAVISLKEENATQKLQINELYHKIFQLKANTILPSDSPLWIFDNEIPAKSIRNYANLLLQKDFPILGVFSSDHNEEYKYILASKQLDVRPLAQLLNQQLSGKGGGSKEMAQGSLSGSKEDILTILSNFSF